MDKNRSDLKSLFVTFDDSGKQSDVDQRRSWVGNVFVDQVGKHGEASSEYLCAVEGIISDEASWDDEVYLKVLFQIIRGDAEGWIYRQDANNLEINIVGPFGENLAWAVFPLWHPNYNWCLIGRLQAWLNREFGPVE